MDLPPAAGIALRGVFAYLVVIVYIRASGNRTLAKMRAFDFVVTIALGSLLANTILDLSTPLWHGLLALGLLVGLQWLVAKLSVVSEAFRKLVTNEAVTLYEGSEYDERALRKARITRDEVESAVRSAGHTDLQRVEKVVLEVNGEVSVVARPA